jgi:hypothetical protein
MVNWFSVVNLRTRARRYLGTALIESRENVSSRIRAGRCCLFRLLESAVQCASHSILVGTRRLLEERQMHRLVLALAFMSMVVCAESASSAEPGLEPIYPAEICWPLPPSYPRGWEIVIHTPCPPGYYLPHYFRHEHKFRALHRATHVVGPIHRRPYLRPGWWW